MAKNGALEPTPAGLSCHIKCMSPRTRWARNVCASRVRAPHFFGAFCPSGSARTHRHTGDLFSQRAARRRVVLTEKGNLFHYSTSLPGNDTDRLYRGVFRRISHVKLSDSLSITYPHSVRHLIPSYEVCGQTGMIFSLRSIKAKGRGDHSAWWVLRRFVQQ